MPLANSAVKKIISIGVVFDKDIGLVIHKNW